MLSTSTRPLPTPRALLTSLINSLPGPDPQLGISTVPSPYIDHSSTKASNPFRKLPLSAKITLTSIHTIYPLLLLPALDLLDRGLVTRVVQDATSPLVETNNSIAELVPEQAKAQNYTQLAGNMDRNEGAQSTIHDEKSVIPTNSWYRVQSAQESRSKSTKSSHRAAGTTTTYVVRLQAWNCSCAAFAFSAFSGSHGIFTSRTDSTTGHLGNITVNDGKSDEEGEGSRKWSFGGLGLERFIGRGAGEVPCCKHLLACVLVDRWKSVLGSYLEERRVGREEMAGLATGW